MTNPYSPPVPALPAEQDLKADAKRRLSRPATALLVMSSIQSVLVAISIVSSLVAVSRDDSLSYDSLVLAFGCVQFAGLVVIAIGAAKMAFLESLTMARLGASLACVPFVTPFLIVGIPFGVWSLRLLSDPAIQASFSSSNSRAE